MTREEQEEWRKVRAAVLDRDNFTCQRCGKRSGNGKALTAHHIMPRSEGGANDLYNLIALCNRCHDVVELAGYRTHAEICSMDDDPVVDNEKPLYDREESFPRPAWHKYVYGGQRRHD